MKTRKRYIVETKGEHNGHPYVVIFTSMGHRCGYVGVYKEHPLYGIEYFDSVKTEGDSNMTPEFFFDVHGGLTYSGDKKGGYPVPSCKNIWRFGFDCAHLYDSPDVALCESLFGKTPYISQPTGTIRTKEFCVAECISLIDQIIKVTPAIEPKN